MTSTDMMSELEQQASIIMKTMYDGVNDEHLIAFQVILIEFQVRLIATMT